jgi:hypothetical protein
MPLQVLSNSSVSSGVGVYWMFYSGGDFEAVRAPPGLPGAAAGDAVEGLRMRPGLAMSQVGTKICVMFCAMITAFLFFLGDAIVGLFMWNGLTMSQVGS